MAREVFQLEELDDATADYLRTVRKTQGEGLAGVYLNVGDTLPFWGIVFGILVIIGTLFVVIPPLNDPMNLAMLLTAAVLFGGWLILAGIRVYVSRSAGGNLGNFFFVDPWHLWNVTGTRVEHFDLEQVQAARVEESRNDKGAYQNSTLVLKTPSGVDRIILNLEVGARELQAYIEYWLQHRNSGPLTPATAEHWAAAAKGYAYDQAPDPRPVTVNVLKPEKVRQARFGWLNLLLVAAAGAGLFAAIQPMVIAWRDDAIFDLVRRRPPSELRGYLIDPRNTRHRKEALDLLAAGYAKSIDDFKDRMRKTGDAKLADTIDPTGQMLQSIATAEHPIISLRVREKGNNPVDLPRTASERQTEVQTALADAFLSALGPERVSIASPPEGVPALVEIEYELVPESGKEKYRYDATVTIRKSPDDEPMVRRTWQGEPFPSTFLNENLRKIATDFVGNNATATPWEDSQKDF